MPRLDPTSLPAAGKLFTGNGDTTQSTLAANASERPSTPEKLRKYRKDTEPGNRTIHHGVYDDVISFNKTVEDKQIAFGKVGRDSDHVSNVIISGPQSTMGTFLAEKKEEIYDTHRREPLGRPYVRGHKLPAKTQAKDFAFGKPAVDRSKKTQVCRLFTH